MEIDSVTINNISSYVHNTLKLYCEIFENDNTKSDWKEAPQWQVDSTNQLVKEVLSGEGLSAEDRHILWVNNLKAQGVIYGKEKTFFNEKLLTHPLLVPYIDLNDFEKSKDFLVNFLVNEFYNFLKNKTKNTFKINISYEVNNYEISFFIETKIFLLDYLFLVLKQIKINNLQIKSYTILLKQNDKYERLLKVEKFK